MNASGLEQERRFFDVFEGKGDVQEGVSPVIHKDFVIPHWLYESVSQKKQSVKSYVRGDLNNPVIFEPDRQSAKLE